MMYGGGGDIPEDADDQIEEKEDLEPSIKKRQKTDQSDQKSLKSES